MKKTNKSGITRRKFIKKSAAASSVGGLYFLHGTNASALPAGCTDGMKSSISSAEEFSGGECCSGSFPWGHCVWEF